MSTSAVDGTIFSRLSIFASQRYFTALRAITRGNRSVKSCDDKFTYKKTGKIATPRTERPITRSKSRHLMCTALRAMNTAGSFIIVPFGSTIPGAQ